MGVSPCPHSGVHLFVVGIEEGSIPTKMIEGISKSWVAGTTHVDVRGGTSFEAVLLLARQVTHRGDGTDCSDSGTVTSFDLFGHFAKQRCDQTKAGTGEASDDRNVCRPTGLGCHLLLLEFVQKAIELLLDDSKLADCSLATTVGLWLWNLRIVLGEVLEGGLADIPTAQLPRETTTEILGPIDITTNADDEALAREAPSETHREVNEAASNTEVLAARALQVWTYEAPTKAAMHKRISTWPGWSFEPHMGVPICPAHKPLRLHQVRAVTCDSVEIRFRTRRSDCNACPLRGDCTRSSSAKYRKELAIRVAAPPDILEIARCSQLRGRAATSTHSNEGYSQRVMARLPTLPPRVAPPEPQFLAGSLAVRGPVLLALCLAKHFRDHTRDALIHIDAQIAPAKPKPPNYYVTGAADRQRRRQTWEQRNRWNELPEGSTVTIKIALPRNRLAAHAAIESQPQGLEIM